ncbi:MAG: hypothetical protein ACJAVH_002173 [Bacteroidia bacterium]|jgi:hypothetical protein
MNSNVKALDKLYANYFPVVNIFIQKNNEAKKMQQMFFKKQ